MYLSYVGAQWINALLGLNTECGMGITFASRLGERLATCPHKKTLEMKYRFGTLCAINGSLFLFYKKKLCIIVREFFPLFLCIFVREHKSETSSSQGLSDAK